MLLDSGPKQGAARPRRRVVWPLGLLVLLAWGGIFFAAGFAFRDFIRPSLQALTGRTQLDDALDSVLRAPGRWIRARVRPAPVETLHLDIRFRHLRKIHEKREEALAQGLLVTADDDMVPAEIRHGDRTLPVKLRLKGDLSDHLEGDKWSFRIHVRRGDALFGMRRFSIQAPSTRGFQAEPLFFETLRQEGVLAPRYVFVDVRVNGKDIGLMGLEEHFSKELLESQRRREGVILKFDESLFWENVLVNGQHGPYDNYRLAPIVPFGGGGIEASPTLSADLAASTALLRAFVEEKVTASQAFDEELLGRFLAVCELWSSLHAVRWHNLRFYFNPVDRELEPIGFDGNLQAHYVGNGLLVLEEPIGRLFLSDARVREAYVRNLRRLAGQMVDGSLPARLRELEAPLLRVLQAEFPLRAPVDFGPLVARARELDLLEVAGLANFRTPAPRSERSWPAVVVASLVEDANGPLLELRNPLPLPVRIETLSVRSNRADDGALPGLPLRLEPTDVGGRPEPVTLRLPGQAARAADAVVEGTAVVDGAARPYRFEARRSPATASGPLLPAVDTETLLRRHAFLARDEDAGFLRVRPGTWSVEAPLLLPEGLGLRMAAGTTLRFAPEASLVARGPLDFRGRPDAPIVLEPRDESAAGAWRGVLVLGAGQESRWSHVQVRGTDAFRLGAWSLTGAITFYESDARLEYCRFTGNRGEDSLNVIRSRLTLLEPVFRDAASDAFDGDFVEGSVVGGLFEDVAGDAVDVSGSQLEVRGTVFRRIRDKAVSVGEGSRLVASGLLVEQSGTGIASKDRSEAVVSDSTLRGIEHVALMAYVKKAEYGPASLQAHKITVEGAAHEALAQTGSRITLDGRSVPETEFDVDRLYREGYMKK